MLIRVVSKYLSAHKRLVIPQLGAFLVKEPGVCVVFSELIKRDDGVLRGLLRDGGLGELEAAGEIDRFVFEVRHAVENGRPFDLEGLGRLRPGANGTIAFDYRPAPAEEPEESVHSARQEPERAAAESAETDPAASHEAGADPGEGAAPAEGPDERPDEAEAGSNGRGASGHIRSERIAEVMKSAFADDAARVSPSAKMNPDPAIRGLQYGRPHKTTDAYRYVERKPRRRGVDRFLLVALLAALIAIAAIGFGYWRKVREARAEQEAMHRWEQQFAPAAQEAEGSGTQPEQQEKEQ